MSNGTPGTPPGPQDALRIDVELAPRRQLQVIASRNDRPFHADVFDASVAEKRRGFATEVANRLRSEHGVEVETSWIEAEILTASARLRTHDQGGEVSYERTEGDGDSEEGLYRVVGVSRTRLT